MKKKVGILGIYHESNTFLSKKTTLQDFKAGHLLFGTDIRKEYQDAHHEIGGMLEVLDENDIEAIPIMFAEAIPGGSIDENTFGRLTALMFEHLKKAGYLDGILVPTHGAAVCESYPDMDGQWLAWLRSKVGGDCPIIGTIDPHANMSDKMVRNTDALIAYRTNPHLDQRETGRRAAQLLIKVLDGRCKPTQVLVKAPVAISIEQQFTDREPCVRLYEMMETLTDNEPFLSYSVILGFPYADVVDMGSSFIIVTDNDPEAARTTGEKLSEYLEHHRESFLGERVGVEESVQLAMTLEKPVLLLDMGDNVGGGSPADSTFILHALEAKGSLRSFICLYDPESVENACNVGLEKSLELAMGGKTDDRHGIPFTGQVKVKDIVDGVFKELQPRHGGQVNFNMGKTVIVTTKNNTTIMLTSKRMVPFSLSQLTTFGIKPSSFDVIVAKGVHAPLGAYKVVCKTFLQVDSPGITQADMTRLPFKNRRVPLFPFERS